MKLKQTLFTALAVGVLFGTLPAAGAAASRPVVEYDAFGNSAELSITSIPGDHVHSAQVEMQVDGSVTVQFSPAITSEVGDTTCFELRSEVEAESSTTTFTLYIDRYGDLNDGSTAFLGTLTFQGAQAPAFGGTASLKLLDERLRPLADTADGFYRDVPVRAAGSGSGTDSPEDYGSTSGSASGGGTAATARHTVSAPSVSGGTVRVSPSRASKGDTVTVTAVPDAGFVLESIAVYDSKGRELELKDRGNGRYTFTMPDGAVEIEARFVAADGGGSDTVQAAGLPFADVQSGEWYRSAVEFVYRNGMMAGTSANAFSPDMPTSRAMIVSILHRLEGSPAAGAGRFPDVTEGQYYTGAVSWAAEHDIVSGYSTGYFRPDDGITREQLAAILYRYARYRGYDTSADAGLGRFADAAGVSAYAAAPMRWAVGLGLISGTNRGLLDPAGGATRAQSAAILMRFCQSFTELT